MAIKEKQTIDTPSYAAFLEKVKLRIRSSQIKAALKVNAELILLYWHIGKEICERQEEEGWGANIITQLAQDIHKALPGIEGFSRTNLFRMRAFYVAYSKVPQAVGQLDNLLQSLFCNIPWGHNILLIEKISKFDQRIWYAQKAIENGWSRSMMEDWIKSDLYHRQGKAITNFKKTLPTPQSDLAQQILKDPYCFDFLTLAADAIEKDLEDGLIEHIQKFLIELGQGFAFVGRQYHIEVEGDPYYLDLLFYHLHLRCYFVIELKAGDFKPEYAGKLNF